MSTPTTSTGPTPPGPTSNPVALRGWFKSIIDWIKGLSPAGATVYDTGWLTLSSGTINVWARRVGRVVTINVDMSTITGVTDDVVFIGGGAALIPVDMRPPRQVFGSGTADQPDITLHAAVLYVQPHGALAFVKSKLATRGLAGTVTYICG